MGEYLKADLDRIGTTADELRFLYGEFSGAQQAVDDYRGYLGSGSLANRLDDFVDNWDLHRRWLCESLDGVARAAQAGFETYTGVEAELTRALQAAFDAEQA